MESSLVPVLRREADIIVERVILPIQLTPVSAFSRNPQQRPEVQSHEDDVLIELARHELSEEPLRQRRLRHSEVNGHLRKLTRAHRVLLRKYNRRCCCESAMSWSSNTDTKCRDP